MHDVIRKPLITEKNTLLANKNNEYGFEVDLSANRSQIKKAIEKLFGVKVVRVNTMIGRQDPRKLGKRPGHRKLVKKAFVKLKTGETFDFVAS